MEYFLVFILGGLFFRYIIDFLDMLNQYIGAKFNCEVSKVTLKNNEFLIKNQEIIDKNEQNDTYAIGFAPNYEENDEIYEDFEE